MKTIIEPFKIKMVEPIQLTTPAERDSVWRRACYVKGAVGRPGCRRACP
jgi:hypothetical protein